MVGEELKWRQLAHHQLMSHPRTCIAKTNNKKAQISGRMLSSGISDIASMHSEKTRLKKCMMIMIIIIIIMNKLQEMTVFSGRQKLTSAMKLRSEK